jgi:hypothetical protein
MVVLICGCCVWLLMVVCYICVSGGFVTLHVCMFVGVVCSWLHSLTELHISACKVTATTTW